MEFLRSFLKPHVSGSTKCRLFFSGYDLLSFFFQFELARKLKEPIQIIHYSARDNTYCQLHLISFPAVFLSSGQRVSTKRTLWGRGGGGVGEELSYTVLYLLKLAGLSIAIANQMIVLTMEVLRVTC